MIIKRSITSFVHEFINEKMILLSGPRQAGKTFFSEHLQDNALYLNYDHPEHRKELLSQSWDRRPKLVIFDELHKMKKWKTWLKGIYDVEKLKQKILVTGSAKMNTFKKTGDSLAGRHFHLRLFPLSIAEVDRKNHQELLIKFLKFGPFPEPFLKNSERFGALWKKGHLDIILRQDLIDLEKVRELKSIEILIELLAERTGSGINYANLARDLQVHPQTIKKWIEILEELYVIFSIKPYSKKFSKAILKEPKVYFYDYSRVKDPAARLENLVAFHLYKRNAFLEDTEGRNLDLCYFRDKEKREVDFIITEENRPTHLLEVKTSDMTPSPHLFYLKERIADPKLITLQLVKDCSREKNFNGVEVCSLSKFLSTLET